MLGTNAVIRKGFLWNTQNLRKIYALGRGFANFRGSFYVVNRPDKHSDGVEVDSNWELLSPDGTNVRFFLPGSVGPAGHDDVSLSFMTSSCRKYRLKDFKLEVLECPVLLRAGLSDLFPASEVVSSSSISIIKILFKKSLPSSSDHDMEQISKQFVCVAEQICDNLKQNGYWADFINPFSGSARYSHSQHFCTEDGISCLKSTMEDNGFCKVINTGVKPTRSKYLGSLYTTAPIHVPLMQDLIKFSNI